MSIMINTTVGGLEMWETGEWVSWYDEKTGLNCPIEYLSVMAEKE